MARLTTEQQALLRPLVTEYPTAPPSPGRYPPPRPRGSVILPSGRRVTIPSPAEQAALVAPQTRAFWFKVTANAATRSTIMTPRVRGPALIRVLAHGTGAANTADAIHFQLGVAAAVAEEVNVALTTPKPYRALFEQMTTYPSGVSANIGGYPSDTLWGTGGDKAVPQGFIVVDQQFHVACSNLNASAGAISYFGVVYIVEGADPEALAGFL